MKIIAGAILLHASAPIIGNDDSIGYLFGGIFLVLWGIYDGLTEKKKA